MPEIHKVKCSKCGKTESMERPSKIFNSDESYNLPPNWREINIHHGGVTGHLCPECWHDYLCIEELFLHEDLPQDTNIENPELQGNIKRDNNE